MEQTVNEERWNALSHGFGAALGILGLFVLIHFDTGKSEFSTFSIVLYSFSMIVLFLSSTIYHAVSNKHLKNVFRKLDHISIYLLIAGTYTPIALITLEKGSGWTIFWVVWSIAIAGTVLKIFFTGRFDKLSLLLYLFMGWLIVFDLQSLLSFMSEPALYLMMAGGAFYTLGTIFYAIERIPYNHVIWHFFVLGGAISHYFMVLLEVA
ncbi:PAQR family membrane homeostasis protein TrhA [Robertkochia aurantiaca]|uniref:PAQR family membrane homeostasis protein TrhA n=1 Tax=Robertkochia aurantiaca TaxID=2873700 RepID=UPI001CC918F7|nr:hemolysin III family protein [Robertkochia sp. 3YJGBD-33]